MVDAEKVKKGLDICALRSAGDCTCCPYFENTYCNDLLASDAAEYIESLDERIAIMQESMEALEKQVAESWPTPHAQWLVYKSGNANCSACGYEIFSGRERTPYCPRCGCVMEEVSE